MKTLHYILMILALQLLATCVARADEEVLPSVTAEKMSEYKNAFGKAISESRAQMGEPAGNARPGSRIDSGLQSVTRKMRDGLDRGGPGPNPGGGDKGGAGGFPPGSAKGMPGGPPPPGFGGPGQPGEHPAGGGGHGGESKAPAPPHP